MNKFCQYLIVLNLLIVCFSILCLAGPTLVKAADAQEKHGGGRVHDRDLSDIEHDDDDDEDDHKYDHEAFAGKDDAKKFDQMSPEESKINLMKIVDKIDKNKDGFVDEKEMKEWIAFISNRYITEDAKRQFKEYVTSLDGKLNFDDYKSKAFGKDPNTDAATAKLLKREERRWKLADQDGDGLLTLKEYTDFTHPEEAPHMKEIVGDETLEDMDKNGDGFLDEEEYIKDMWTPIESEKIEPEWVKTERETFKTLRDKNKDGKLDKQEILDWIIPPDYNHVDAETKHLFSQADINKDGKLSREEIEEKHDVFVGSQATDFGEALGKHDEL